MMVSSILQILSLFEFEISQCTCLIARCSQSVCVFWCMSPILKVSHLVAGQNFSLKDTVDLVYVAYEPSVGKTLRPSRDFVSWNDFS